MPNGSGLTGNPAGNQPVAIAQVPGSTTEFYVFTNSANGTTGGTISYSIVDISAPGNETFPTPPIGNVTSKNIVIGGLPNRSESMIVIPHTNDRDFWLSYQWANAFSCNACCSRLCHSNKAATT